MTAISTRMKRMSVRMGYGSAFLSAGLTVWPLRRPGLGWITLKMWLWPAMHSSPSQTILSAPAAVVCATWRSPVALYGTNWSSTNVTTTTWLWPSPACGSSTTEEKSPLSTKIPWTAEVFRVFHSAALRRPTRKDLKKGIDLESPPGTIVG